MKRDLLALAGVLAGVVLILMAIMQTVVAVWMLGVGLVLVLIGGTWLVRDVDLDVLGDPPRRPGRRW